MQSIHNFIKLLSLVSVLLLVGCEKEEVIDVQFVLPETISGSTAYPVSFSVKKGKAPLLTDSFILQTPTDDEMYAFQIIETSSESFSVKFNMPLTGRYDVYIKRGPDKRYYGSATVGIVLSFNIVGH